MLMTALFSLIYAVLHSRLPQAAGFTLCAITLYPTSASTTLPVVTSRQNLCYYQLASTNMSQRSVLIS